MIDFKKKLKEKNEYPKHKALILLNDYMTKEESKKELVNAKMVIEKSLTISNPVKSILRLFIHDTLTQLDKQDEPLT